VSHDLEQPHPRRDITLAALAFAIAFVLWQVQGLSLLTYPLRLFVTMIHELGHGLAAILTGGEFLQFEVSKRGAGLATTVPGSRFIIIQAGYLGTAVFGAVLLLLTNRTRRTGLVAIGVGLFIIVLTVLFSGISLSNLNFIESVIALGVIGAGSYLILTRETNEGRYVGLGVGLLGALLSVVFAGGGNVTLTVAIGVLSGLILIGVGYRASRDVNVVLLNFLAFMTGLQAITDAWVLLKIVSLPSSMVPNNDASSMAREFGGPAALWAMLWIAVDIVIFGAAVYVIFIKPMRAGREPAAAPSRD